MGVLVFVFGVLMVIGVVWFEYVYVFVFLFGCVLVFDVLVW